MSLFSPIRPAETGRTAGQMPGGIDKKQERFLHLLSITETAGPVLSLFRQYLSTRIDMFSEKECRQLAASTHPAISTPFSLVQENVERNLGRPTEHFFLAVEPTPHATTLLTVSYLAMLHSGESITLTTLRPEFVLWPLESLDTLRLRCADAFPSGGPSTSSAHIINDFEQELRERLDLFAQAGRLAILAKEAAESEFLCAPKVRIELCRPALLVTERIHLTRLKELLAGSAEQKLADDGHTPSLGGFSRYRLSRNLCTGWLRAVFLARSFQVYCRAEDVFVGTDGGIAFLSAPYFSLSSDSSGQIWSYLRAVAADNPDECCRGLLQQTIGHISEAEKRELIAQFRQAVTFNHATPGEDAPHTGTAMRIQHQLEQIKNAGLRLRPSVLNFYRGLFCLLSAIRSLQPERDPMPEAIEDIWATGILGSFKQMMRSDVFADMANNYAAAMIEAPRKINEMLTTYGAGNQTEKDDSGRRDKREASNSSRITLLLLAAAVLILVRSPALQIPALWIDRVSFLICCLAGFLALKIATSA